MIEQKAAHALSGFCLIKGLASAAADISGMTAQLLAMDLLLLLLLP